MALLLFGFVAVPAPAIQDQTAGDATPVAADESAAEADEALRRAVARRLQALDGFSEVEVEAEAGVVRLRGEVLSLQRLEEAESVAEAVEGAAEVVNEIEVIRDPREVIGPALAELADRAQSFLAWLPLLAVALLVVAAFAVLAGWVGRRERLYRRLSHNRFVQDLWRQILRAATFVTGVLVALELLDATALVGAVLGAAGVVGLAIGFAFRNVAENFIASALLSLRQPFLPNDHVVIDGDEGKVLRLTPRATVLLTLDGNHLRIPNAKVFNAVLLNYSRNPKRRFDVAVGVGTDEDLLLAQQIGVETLTSIDGVAAEPAPSTVISELGDSSVIVKFFAWVDQREHDFFAVRSEAMRLVKGALEDEGMDLPEPIYRLRIDKPAARAGAESRSARRQPSMAPATQVDDTIDTQIEEERRASSDDLLSSTAPME